MDWVGAVVAAMFGAAVGSFINVVADRLPEGQSLVSPPSHCPVCQRRIAAWDLVPIVSYAVLQGRCRGCRSRIPVRVPLVEVAMAVMFAAAWAMYGATYQGFAAMGYIAFFTAVLIIDLEHHIIPNKMVFPGLVAALAMASFWPGVGPGDALIGAAAGFGIFLMLYLVPGMVIGEGDVKLAAVVGAATGLPAVVVSVGVSFLLGGVVAGVLLATRRTDRKGQMPFGPYMAVAALVGIGWGETIWQWYLSTFTPF